MPLSFKITLTNYQLYTSRIRWLDRLCIQKEIQLWYQTAVYFYQHLIVESKDLNAAVYTNTLLIILCNLKLSNLVNYSMLKFACTILLYPLQTANLVINFVGTNSYILYWICYTEHISNYNWLAIYSNYIATKLMHSHKNWAHDVPCLVVYADCKSFL